MAAPGFNAASSIGSMGCHAAACTTPPIELGLVLFNRNLTTDPKKKIATTLASSNQHLPCSLDDLLNEAVKLEGRRVGHLSVAHKRIDNVITTIHQHAKVIDVLIQQQPDILALVWGGFRFLINVAAKELDTSERIGEALVDIVESLGRWNKYIELFEEFERVRSKAADLFSQIINFLVRAKLYYQKPRAVRNLKVVFSKYTQKFENIMSLIHSHADGLEREATLASEIKRMRDRKGIIGSTLAVSSRGLLDMLAQERHMILEREEFEKQSQFRTELSQNARETCSELKGVVKSLEQDALSQDSLAAINWLHGWKDSPHIKPDGEEGTCLWIQQDNEWSTWVRGHCKQPLCICGSPGTGKSTIANHLFKTAETVFSVLILFQSVTNKEQASSTPFAAAVLGQLLQQESVKISPVYSLVVIQLAELSRSNKIVGGVAFSRLWSIVLLLIKSIPDFSLIVDGLDECDERSREELGSTLIELSSQSNTRVIVLFRYHPQLERVFHDCPTIELTPTAILKDIHIYATGEIKRHPKKLLLLENEIIEAISKSSQGMFLYAEMMLECLKSADTYAEQLAYLTQAPPDLYTFYEELASNTAARLSSGSLIRRREILVILAGTYKALTCQELSFVLNLGVDGTSHFGELDTLIDSEETILRLCWPLVRVSKHHVHLMHWTVKEFLMQPLCKTKHSISITSDESEAYLASKSLAALSQPEYRSPNKIAILIRQNVASAAEQEEDKYFYQYAATHWYLHLTAVQSPELSLVQQVARFLYGNEFVSWSEFIFQISGSQGTMLEVESKLNIWRNNLSKDLKGLLHLKSYFSGPYRAAATWFEEDAGDKTLPFLCLFQLGEYYNLAARIEEAFQVKRTVAEGLVNLLGERHPLSLMAESAFALEYLGQRRFPEAEATFSRLAKIQREVLGTDRPDCFQSLQRQGMAELWMTKFADADANLTESLSGFFNTVGVKSFLYLMSQLTLGQVLEYQGELRRATLDYEHIWRYRTSILGPDNPMAVWARCAMVSTYRKLGRYEEADKAVVEVIDARNRTIGPKSSPTVDALIQRLVVYLDFGKFEEAMELVDFILDGGLVDDWFERAVQVDHVLALLEFFAGNIELAISTLQSLIAQSLEIGVEGRVRSLLWVRLDLAKMLRREDRGDEALILFEDLVTSVDSDSSSSWAEPDSPVDLIIAEKALILVRELKSHDAAVLLAKKGLKWVRQEDFWILNGSPAADTTCMKGP